MTEQNRQKLNSLQRLLPPGLFAPAGWLAKHAYRTNLIRYYTAHGRLESPARGVYQLPGTRNLKWQSVVASLQLLDECWSHIGGRTALVQRGLGHYAQLRGGEIICLYGPHVPPDWVNKLGLAEKFEGRSDAAFSTWRVVRTADGTLTRFGPPETPISASELGDLGLTEQKWGPQDWPLIFSTEERAILEMLQDVPERESIYEAYVLLQGLVNLRPDRVSALLRKCHSIKAKRLFAALAARLDHAWFKRVDIASVDFGKGKRALFPGGKFDARFQITLPADLDEHAR